MASHMLEAGPHDLEFRDGKIGVKGASGLEVSIAEVATQAHFFRPSLPDGPPSDQRSRCQLHLRPSAGDAVLGKSHRIECLSFSRHHQVMHIPNIGGIPGKSYLVSRTSTQPRLSTFSFQRASASC